MTVVEKANQVW